MSGDICEDNTEPVSDTGSNVELRGYDNVVTRSVIGDSEGFLKLLFRASDMKLLGVNVIGEGATELVHVGMTALLLDADAEGAIRLSRHPQ